MQEFDFQNQHVFFLTKNDTLEEKKNINILDPKRIFICVMDMICKRRRDECGILELRCRAIISVITHDNPSILRLAKLYRTYLYFLLRDISGSRHDLTLNLV